MVRHAIPHNPGFVASFDNVAILIEISLRAIIANLLEYLECDGGNHCNSCRGGAVVFKLSAKERCTRDESDGH
jgi:hypothetical protein